MCLGSSHASNTNSRGALKTRAITISRSAVLLMTLLLSESRVVRGQSVLLASPRLAFGLKRFVCFHPLQVQFEAIEALLPVLAVTLDELGDGFEGSRLEPARAALCVAATRNEACVLQHP